MDHNGNNFMNTMRNQSVKLNVLHYYARPAYSNFLWIFVDDLWMVGTVGDLTILHNPT